MGGGAGGGAGVREEERESSSPAAPRLPGSLPELQAAVLGPRAASWAPGKAAQDAEKSCPRPRRLGLWDAAAGSCAGPGLQPACSHARLGFLRVGAGAGALRGCRIPWHWACGGPTTERARTRTTHTHKRVRARTHTVCTRTPPSHTHTHTPLRGTTAGRPVLVPEQGTCGVSVPGARRRVLTHKTHLFGDSRQGQCWKMLSCGPAAPRPS